MDLSAEPGTQPVTVGALGSMQSLTIKLGGSHAVAPRVHAQDMLTLGTAQPTEITPHTTWSEVSRTVIAGSLGCVFRKFSSDRAARAR